MAILGSCEVKVQTSPVKLSSLRQALFLPWLTALSWREKCLFWKKFYSSTSTLKVWSTKNLSEGFYFIFSTFYRISVEEGGVKLLDSFHES